MNEHKWQLYAYGLLFVVGLRKAFDANECKTPSYAATNRS